MNSKTIYQIVSVLLGAGLIFALTRNGCNTPEAPIDNVEYWKHLSDSTNQALEKFRDSVGRQKVLADADLLQSLNDSKYANDSLAQALRNERRLHSITKLELHTAMTMELPVVTDTVYVDSNDHQSPVLAIDEKFEYKDDWMSLNGKLRRLPFLVVDSAGNPIRNSVKIEYKIKNDVSIEPIWKKQGFLRPDKLQVRVFSNNPHTDVTDVRMIMVDPRRPKWYETRGFQLALTAVATFLTAKAAK